MNEDIEKALMGLDTEELVKVHGFIMTLINVKRIREIANRPATREIDYHEIIKDVNDLLNPQRFDYDE